MISYSRIRVGAQVFFAARLDERPRVIWMSLLVLARHVMGRHHLTPDEMWIKLQGYWFRVALAQAEMDGFLQAWVFAVYEPKSTFAARPGDVVVDGGANVGFYATRQASRGARVLAFEPNPQTFARLKAGLMRNRLNDLVTAFPAALGDHRGVRDFYVNDANSVTGSLFMDSGSYRRRTLVQVDVQVLDEVLAKLGLDHVDVIKLDVEGAEGIALEGAVESLPHARGVVIECHSHELREYCTTQLRRAGLRVAHEDGQHIAYMREGTAPEPVIS